MNCSNCKHTDGLVYTSYPPQIRCIKTGEFHFYDDECNCNLNNSITFTININKKQLEEEGWAPIIRCKNCKYYDTTHSFYDDNTCTLLYECDGTHITPLEDDYCSFGREK